MVFLQVSSLKLASLLFIACFFAWLCLLGWDFNLYLFIAIKITLRRNKQTPCVYLDQFVGRNKCVLGALYFYTEIKVSGIQVLRVEFFCVFSNYHTKLFLSGYFDMHWRILVAQDSFCFKIYEDKYEFTLTPWTFKLLKKSKKVIWVPFQLFLLVKNKSNTIDW